MTLSDNAVALVETQQRVSQLQRVVDASEHDRRVLQERLDITRSLSLLSSSSSLSMSSSSTLVFPLFGDKQGDSVLVRKMMLWTCQHDGEVDR